EYFFKALKTMEESGDQAQIATIYNSLGIAFGRQHNNVKALEYYRKELEIGEKLKDENAIATGHSNIGTVLAEQGKYEEALKEFNLFMESAIKANDKYSIGVALLNIGDIYTRKGEYGKALETNSKGMSLFEDLGTKYEAGLTYFNQGNTYLFMAKLKQGNIKHNLSEAKKNIEKALFLFEKGGLIEDISYCYLAFSSLDSCFGNNKGALENYKKYIVFRDSLLNQMSTAKSVRAEMNYEFDKKEAISNLEQERKDAIANQENARQKSIRNLFIVAFGFMLLLAIFIFKSYHQKRKVNNLISSQKLEVEKQKWIVEKNQKQIIDSINYARRIQTSMLPNESILKKAFPQSFVLYKPKDIVSGDFYWFYSIPGTSQSVIVLADCTGHGVPGAFLSMVGTTLLNEIVCHKNISDPAGILKALNSGLTSTLISKKEETHSDGMDISIIKLDGSVNKLFFAGANQTLYLVYDQTVEKIEPQVYSIDGAFDLEEDQDFVSIEKDLKHPTSIFMTTDGYADQTGEATRKKFLSSRFEKLLLEIHTLSSNEQIAKLEQTFNEWKGNQKQIDDILVIGVKV
ncbi:MAG: tetratricopeptide repeat protein, partial [Bacteroidia bacterium]